MLIVLCANICQALLANCATQLKVQLVGIMIIITAQTKENSLRGNILCFNIQDFV